MGKKTEHIQTITIPLIANDQPVWDWSGFPKDRIPDLKTAFEKQDQSAMITLHNKYRLSENSFCCSGGNVLLYNVEKFIKTLKDETV